MTNSMPPPTNAPPLTPFSAPASSTTSISTPGSGAFGPLPLQISPGPSRSSSIPLKKRSLANDNTASGSLVKQMSTETITVSSASATAAATNAINNDLGISLNDWLKSRVLAVSRRSRLSSSHHHRSRRLDEGSEARAAATAAAMADESDETACATSGGMDDEWLVSSNGPVFLDYVPAVIDNTNGTLVTVTFTAPTHGANSVPSTAAPVTTGASTDEAVTNSSSNLVLSQSLPANLSMLPFHRYLLVRTKTSL